MANSTQRQELLPAMSGPSEPFVSFLKEARPEINERIDLIVSSFQQGGRIDKELAAFLSQGKRLRAGLALLTFEAFSPSDRHRETVLELAAAIEIAHSSSLILDDMLDGDEMRRGQRALHLSRGNSKAMLEMVGMLSLPYDIASRHGSAYVSGLAQTHGSMVEGALLEIEARGGPVSFATYDSIITHKTGHLFCLSTRFGAMAAGCGDGTVESMSTYGLLAGKAMQMADDIADLRRGMEDGASLGHGSERMLLQCVLEKMMGPSGLEQASSRRMELFELLNDLLQVQVESAQRSFQAAMHHERAGTSERRPDGKRLEALLEAPADIANMLLDGE